MKKRFVVPNLVPEPVKQPRLKQGDVIGDHMTLARLTPGQFHALRSKYLNAGIKTTGGNLKFPTAVLVDGKIIGVFCFGLWQNADRILLTTDFAVGPHDYPKLSKLVVMAIMSKEGGLIAERGFVRRCRGVQTAVFTNAPVSMKYRSLMTLVDRVELDEGEQFKNKLIYWGDVGALTLDESLAEWKRRWGQRRTDTDPDRSTT